MPTEPAQKNIYVCLCETNELRNPRPNQRKTKQLKTAKKHNFSEFSRIVFFHMIQHSLQVTIKTFHMIQHLTKI